MKKNGWLAYVTGESDNWKKFDQSVQFFKVKIYAPDFFMSAKEGESLEDVDRHRKSDRSIASQFHSAIFSQRNKFLVVAEPYLVAIS